jgi:hypothetical protein
MDIQKTVFKKAALSSSKKRTVGDYSMAQVITPEIPAPAKQNPEQEQPAALIERRVIDEFRNRLKKFHITAENIHVEQGTLQVIRSIADESKESEPLGFSFDLKIRRPRAEVIDVILEDLHLNLGPLFLLGRIEADDVLSKTSRIEIQIRTKPFAISNSISDRTINPARLLPARISGKYGDPATRLESGNTFREPGCPIHHRRARVTGLPNQRNSQVGRKLYSV